MTKSKKETRVGIRVHLVRYIPSCTHTGNYSRITVLYIA